MIEVEVMDPARGGLVLDAKGYRLAAERAPSIWRVSDGTFDFTFTQTELDAEVWIRFVQDLGFIDE
jgi:hypothetical protein